MKSEGLPWVWGATAGEVAASCGCDERAAPGDARLVRAVSVGAPAGVVFAWLGNLRIAPYSYDWLDNLGRRSPRALATHLGPVEPGQRAMSVFTVLGVVAGAEITVRTSPGAGTRLFGDVCVSYRVVPTGSGTARLVAILRLGGGAGVVGRLRRYVLGWGDLLMMRKQLHTLRDLAQP